jgi:hypothetical protein
LPLSASGQLSISVGEVREEKKGEGQGKENVTLNYDEDKRQRKAKINRGLKSPSCL